MLTGRSPEPRSPRRRHTGRWLGAVICATALVATACGSDSDSSSSTDAPATTAAGGAATTAAAGGDAMAAAKANVEAALVRPTKIEVTEPVGATIPKGKTIDWIQCSIPACTQLGTALKEATDTLGWTLNTIDGGITPETIANAWAKAAANKHDAVIASGFPRSIFEQSLQELKAANIPVIDIDVTDPAENGITAVIQGADAYPPLGALQADWVLSQNGEDSHVLRVTTSAFPVVGLSTQGFTDEYKKVCPNCELQTLEAQVTDFGDKLSTQIVAFLQSHPDVNIVSAAVSDMVTGLNSALAGRGTRRQGAGADQRHQPGARAGHPQRHAVEGADDDGERQHDVAGDRRPGPHLHRQAVRGQRQRHAEQVDRHQGQHRDASPSRTRSSRTTRRSTRRCGACERHGRGPIAGVGSRRRR